MTVFLLRTRFQSKTVPQKVKTCVSVNERRIKRVFYTKAPATKAGAFFEPPGNERPATIQHPGVLYNDSRVADAPLFVIVILCIV